MRKRAGRVIVGSNYDVRSKEIFDCLGREPIETIVDERAVIFNDL